MSNPDKDLKGQSCVYTYREAIPPVCYSYLVPETCIGF